MRLYGRESLSSLHKQSLVARRITEHNCRAIAILDCQPQHYQQMAGLVMYYNSYHWHYLHVTSDDEGNRVLQIMTCDKHNIAQSLDSPIQLSKTNDIVLRAEWHLDAIQCYFQDGTKDWIPIGDPLDGSILSDDYVRDESNRYRPAFTGAFVGMCCQDLSGQRWHPDFKVSICENLDKNT